MTIPAANTTLASLVGLVRKLTASPSEASLKTKEIYDYINLFGSADFPNEIKTDQMRTIYTFYTTPYTSTYPIDVNNFQSFRGPFYVDGVQGTITKDRTVFYNLWPQFTTLTQPITGDGVTTTFSFQIQAIPFFPRTVTIGATDTAGNPISIADDGLGNLNYLNVNPRVSVPAQGSPSYPGMYNYNTGNPGLINPVPIGTVNYVTGTVFIDFTNGVIPANGSIFEVRAAQYQTSRPSAILLFNNAFEIRPVPRSIHKIDIEAYQTPIRFLETTSTPIVNQWYQFYALGAALMILRDRQDIGGVQNLMPFYEQQKALILERQASEEIGQRNFNEFYPSYATGSFYGNYGGYGW